MTRPVPKSRKLDFFISSPPRKKSGRKEKRGKEGAEKRKSARREEKKKEPTKAVGPSGAEFKVKATDDDVYYSSLAEAFERLERISSRKAKISLIAQFLRQCPENVIDIVTLFLANQVFPGWDPRDLGIGSKLMRKVIATATGSTDSEVTELFKRLGDLGLAAEELLKRRKTSTLLDSRPLMVSEVRETFEKIAEVEGEGAVKRKMRLMMGLLAKAKPKEARYLVRQALSELRTGVRESTVEEAIAQAFGVSRKLVERAHMLSNDLGLVAKVAMTSGEEGLREIDLRPMRPIKPMLAQAARNVREALAEVGGKGAVEIKLDGARVQVHSDGEEVRVYTRRIEDVTHALPDIVEAVKDCVDADEFILEGEAVAINPETGKPRPFQELLHRIKRKYDIEDVRKEIPVELHLFDCLYVDGESLVDTPFRERRRRLEEIVREREGEVMLVEQVITDDPKEAAEMFHRALEIGHEGVMVKDLDANYTPGVRGKKMLKVKPVLETLDCVVIGGIWGKGKRKGLIGSYLLAVWDENKENLMEVGKVGTGVDDETLERLTKMFEDLIVEESGREVRFKPEVVFEVEFEDIQKSPKYSSGFALRFPRLVRVRDDLGPEDADTIEKVRRIYEEVLRKH
ncbi:ATP-dependent DNA ligase [Methanopyrus sp.]